LLEAAKLAPTVPLAIAGDGPLAPQVREAGGTVHYRGLLGRNELRTALSDAAFTILASEWYENLPFSVLESLAAGRPVIATRMGALPEAVTDGVTGILVDPGDAPALARAMVRVWDSRSASDEMGIRGRAIAELRYSLEGQTRKLIDLYKELGA
jgi:glycosyltransferase involved in cell wall biosynthesis